MYAKLIIIRGNSSSGKTSLAMALKEQWGNTLVVSQDAVRREIIGCSDTKKNPAIEMIESLVSEAITKNDYVILEGILKRSTYYQMIERLMELYAPRSALYYLSVSFETTKCRHLEGLRVNEFSIEQMEQWWIAEDLLDYKSEMLVDGEVEQTDLIEQVMNYIKDN